MSKYKENGFLGQEDLAGMPGIPSQRRQSRGPVAHIECVECIPCNPCESACPHHAIVIGRPITNLPRLDEEKCIGCGICIPHCSGQAIFVVDISKEDTALISMPYEFLPLPSEGDAVLACDRKGSVVSLAKVKKCLTQKTFDKTAILTISVPREFADVVRSIRRVGV